MQFGEPEGQVQWQFYCLFGFCDYTFKRKYVKICLSQEYLTKIFDAFTREQNTTKSKIAGTGLGMSIVKKYVDLLGGTIDVESELGKGSTFTVTLKHRIADESCYAKKHVEELGTGSEILNGKNILLAEDNDLNAEIAETILERVGLKI